MTLPAITRQGSKILLHTKHASLFGVSVGNKEKSILTLTPVHNL